MARLGRSDGEDTWHHVMNRGLARRTVFEDELDVRYFLAHLARTVRAGRIEVHAYCLMTTHFHLLVRSPAGALSGAMQAIANAYVRWFNRTRRRDGALFRGRFRSRPITSQAYRQHLLRYIDFNPVLARVVATPSLYPHGSARCYATQRGPPWLARYWVEEIVRATTNSVHYEPSRYGECFGAPLTPALVRVIERRTELRGTGADPLDDLLGATPEGVLAWMRWKAHLADGLSIDVPVCDAHSVHELVTAHCSAQPDWQITLSRTRVDAWRLVEVAILRDLCGCSWPDIAARLSCTPAGAAQSYARHVRATERNPDYGETLARIAIASISACFGGRRSVSTEPGSNR